MPFEKSIIVPCYNEADNLPSLVERFQALRSPSSDWELILVNNGSNDASGTLLDQLTAEPGREFIQVVTVPSPNVGYGHGIMSGLRAAKGRFLAWTHADGQTPPSDVLKAFELLQSSANPERTFVKGVRKQRPVKDTLFTAGMQAAAATLLWVNLPDINAQPKAFPRSLLELATRPPGDLSLDLYFFWLATNHGYEIRTLEVAFQNREFGQSKWAFNWRSKAKNIARSLKYMTKLGLTTQSGPWSAWRK